jgi:hypothetical protein
MMPARMGKLDKPGREKRAMKLLVTCPKRVFIVDAERRTIGVLQAHSPEYYGVSWTSSGHQLCLAHSGVDDASLESLESYIDSERGWLSIAGNASSSCLSAPHQILCVGDKVVVTNTGRNCLTIFRNQDLYYRHHWFDNVRWDRKGRDNYCGSHFNSVMARNGRLCVLAHNFHRHSYILVLSWPDLHLIKRIECNVSHAHNIWPLSGDQLAVCDSLHGRLVEAKSGETIWSCANPSAFTRGLACHGKYVFVGKSDQSTPGGRSVSDGGVWVLDRDSWRTIDFIPLPGSGVVREIRLLDLADECHHETPLNWLPEPDPQATEEYQSAARASCVQSGARGPESAAAELPFAAAFSGTAGTSLPDTWAVTLGTFGMTAAGLAPRDTDVCIAVLRGVVVSDIAVSAHIELPPGPVCYAGLAACYRGPGDAGMVLGTLVGRDQSVTADLWKHDGQSWKLINSSAVTQRRGTLRLETLGTRMALYFNGELLFEVTDHHSIGGSVGLRALGGCYRDFTAECLTNPVPASHLDPAGVRESAFPRAELAKCDRPIGRSAA